MTSVLSISIAKNHSVGSFIRLCKITRNYNVTQVAFMNRLAYKEERPKPKPFNYRKKELSTRNFMFHLTSLMYDENTKLLVVEGPPCAGKEKLCKKLAEEFGLLYMPPPCHDDIFINPYGFDLPFLVMRYEQYTNAMLHMLATGQGVILNRSVFSDAIFVDTMYKAGYINKDVADYFNVLKKNSLHLLLRPHVVIYLNIPPDVTLENIKKYGTQDEINSEVFTKNYLIDLDIATREKCLTWLSPHSEILIYNSIDERHYMDIVQDIESLNLEEDEKKVKFSDWIFLNIVAVQERLIMYQDKNYMLHKMLRITEKIIPPELTLSVSDREHLLDVLDREPSESYEYNYNPYMGDTIKETKYKFVTHPYMSITRRIMRDFVNCKMFPE
ncbi:unnamed protein product [Xylocopa violacea]|uniref:Deoxynucleoside kinase domain-containing protein n=1 Tax=Xylocopa violacea TaxID=135666 RepID=A0ABP1NR69_XYLVO